MWAGARVLCHALLVGVIGLPVDVTSMMLLDQHLPLIARQVLDAFAPRPRRLERQLRSRLAIDVGAGIDGVAQDLVDGVVARLNPADLGVRAHLQRKLEALIAQPQPHAARRARLCEACEDGADRSHDGFVGMKQDLAVGLTPHEAHGQAAAQLATCGLVANAAVETGSEHMQLGLAHRSFEAEQQTVVEQRRMIDAVGVADQRVGKAGEIDQAVPVGIVAGKARHLQAEHEADTGERNLGGETREAGSCNRAGAGQAEVLVDDENAILGPTELARLAGKRILALRRIRDCARLGSRSTGADRRSPDATDALP